MTDPKLKPATLNHFATTIKLFFIAAMLVATDVAYAQFSIKPLVGLSMASLTGIEDSRAKTGMAMGAEAEYGINGQLSLSASIIYSVQGTQYDDVTTDGIEIRKNLVRTMDFLNFPITANYYVAKGLAVKAGVQPGFLLYAKHKGKRAGIDMNYSEMDYLNKIDVSIPLGMSYEYGNFVIDARYNLGLTDVHKKNIDTSVRNSVIMFIVGYKFTL